LKNYNSDASDNSELADHVVNIGFIYENMKAKDIVLLSAVNIQEIDVDKYNYSLVNTGNLTLSEYKQAVKNALPGALADLIASANAETGTSGRVNNDIYLNKCLVFNTNTMQLAIIGQGVTKNVTFEGEAKVTKKGAATVAKELIKKAANLRTNTYRRYKISNLSAVKITGETIEIA
jgi:hypothetical protein